MIVAPYKRFPLPPTVAILIPDERRGAMVLDEHGSLHHPDNLPDGLKVWGSYDLVHELVGQGVGEALCWNNEEIRWRHARLDRNGWSNRPGDVAVIKLPFPEDHLETLTALGQWRDWLASYGASPTGTSGSAAWSLLRARLERQLFTGIGSPPPVPWTIGGRQELGVQGRGRYGLAEQWDLPAAYASELGGLTYGGFWQDSGQLPKRTRDPEFWGLEGRPVFVRARVRVPFLTHGPLPRRPRKRMQGVAAAFLGCEYPVGGRLQGVWAWPELEQAVAAGAHIEQVLGLWVHFAFDQPFAAWWDAVQAGRLMGGLAGVLAKTTGNALWGRFCMDSKTGKRTIRTRGKRRMEQRSVRVRGGIPAAHDLAETVSGRVRAKLYGAMLHAGPGFLSAHTDGIWLDTLAGSDPGGAWRRKGEARQLDLLDPQVLRYWPKRGHEAEPFHVFAGVPSEQAPRVFEELWREQGFAPTIDLEGDRA